jgi:hypothetical protein
MTKPISAAAASSIEAAISRLMASDDVEARYTIACLASEAGLSRDTLDLVLKAGVTTGVGSRTIERPLGMISRVHTNRTCD